MVWLLVIYLFCVMLVALFVLVCACVVGLIVDVTLFVALRDCYLYWFWLESCLLLTWIVACVCYVCDCWCLCWHKFLGLVFWFCCWGCYFDVSFVSCWCFISVGCSWVCSFRCFCFGVLYFGIVFLLNCACCLIWYLAMLILLFDILCLVVIVNYRLTFGLFCGC